MASLNEGFADVDIETSMKVSRQQQVKDKLRESIKAWKGYVPSELVLWRVISALLGVLIIGGGCWVAGRIGQEEVLIAQLTDQLEQHITQLSGEKGQLIAELAAEKENYRLKTDALARKDELRLRDLQQLDHDLRTVRDQLARYESVAAAAEKGGVSPITEIHLVSSYHYAPQFVSDLPSEYYFIPVWPEAKRQPPSGLSEEQAKIPPAFQCSLRLENQQLGASASTTINIFSARPVYDPQHASYGCLVQANARNASSKLLSSQIVELYTDAFLTVDAVYSSDLSSTSGSKRMLKTVRVPFYPRFELQTTALLLDNAGNQKAIVSLTAVPGVATKQLKLNSCHPDLLTVSPIMSSKRPGNETVGKDSIVGNYHFDVQLNLNSTASSASIAKKCELTLRNTFTGQVESIPVRIQLHPSSSSSSDSSTTYVTVAITCLEYAFNALLLIMMAFSGVVMALVCGDTDKIGFKAACREHRRCIIAAMLCVIALAGSFFTGATQVWIAFLIGLAFFLIAFLAAFTVLMLVGMIIAIIIRGSPP